MSDIGWIVNYDFTVVRVSKGRPVHVQVYNTREEAETAARIKCEEAVEEARAHLTAVKRTLKVERPWEKK